ncbi:hypothetical protein I5535_11315 [Rhodobacteraceae bacterium F11138]|nr:hypothetical protein [Rhodobacteraceae bacterium F11138]
MISRRIGDPDSKQAADGIETRTHARSSVADVVIVGCGSAGLTLATQLSIFETVAEYPLGVALENTGNATKTIRAIPFFLLPLDAYRVAHWKPSLVCHKKQS